MFNYLVIRALEAVHNRRQMVVVYIWYYSSKTLPSLYSIKKSLDFMIDGSACPFTLDENLGITVKNLFHQKNQMLYLLFGYLFLSRMTHFFSVLLTWLS